MKRDVSIVEPGTKSKTRPGFPEKSKIEVQKKQTMKAVALDKFGSPSALTIHELPVPQAGPNEVLIALYASGVGVWDKDIRGGWWPEGMGKPKFPLVLGSDGAGVVAGVGAKVKDFHAGDRVWAYEFINPKGGFYAEYVAVNEQHVALVPKGLDLLHAGAATVTALTALQGIESQLKVRATDTVLIYGASGAVGTSAVQFAKMFGAKVIGTARGTDAQKLVKQLGADLVIDPGEPGAVEQVRKFAPDGIDAVLALAGGEPLQRLVELVRPGGRIVYPNGVEPEPKGPAKVKVSAYDVGGNRRDFERLAHAVEAAEFSAPIASVYALEDAAQAHERLENGHVLGRIVLQIRSKSDRMGYE